MNLPDGISAVWSYEIISLVSPPRLCLSPLTDVVVLVLRVSISQAFRPTPPPSVSSEPRFCWCCCWLPGWHGCHSLVLVIWSIFFFCLQICHYPPQLPAMGLVNIFDIFLKSATPSVNSNMLVPKCHSGGELEPKGFQQRPPPATSTITGLIGIKSA